jgi:methyltransferase
MLSQKLFLVLVALVVVQRLLELWYSKRNEKAILAAGGFDYAHEHFLWMKLIHASWLMSMVLEVWWLERVCPPLFAFLCLGLFLLGQLLRITAILTLKSRWTACIMVLPGKTTISHGIYRYIKHPNYWGVILEIAFLPLIHGAFLSSIIFSLLNLVILKVRISNEESILRRYCSYGKI